MSSSLCWPTHRRPSSLLSLKKPRLGVLISQRFHREHRRPKKPIDPPPANRGFKQSYDTKFRRYENLAQVHRAKPGELVQIKPTMEEKMGLNKGRQTMVMEEEWSELTDRNREESRIVKREEWKELLTRNEKPQILPRTPAVRVMTEQIISSDWDGSQDFELDIIAEDDCYMFVNKPAGISCHGTENENDALGAASAAIGRRPPIGNQANRAVQSPKVRTYHDLFMEHWWTENPFVRFQPGLMHRLDKDVSGVMVYAKKWCSQLHFRRLLNPNNGEYLDGGSGVKKVYVALCLGVPNQDEGTIEGIHAKDIHDIKRYRVYPLDRCSKAVRKYGKPCRTEFKVLDANDHGVFGTVSLVAFSISTGRRHQIRAAAAQILGCPILGDRVYGGPKYARGERIMLHSCFVGFEGVPDSGMLYGVSCMPDWQHLKHNIYPSKAHYFLKQWIRKQLMPNPRPPKKPRTVLFSLRKERMESKRESLTNKPLLLPFAAKEYARALERSAGDGSFAGLIGDGDEGNSPTAATFDDVMRVGNDSGLAIAAAEAIQPPAALSGFDPKEIALFDSKMISRATPMTLQRTLDDRKQIYKLLKNVSHKNDFWSDEELLSSEYLKSPLRINKVRNDRAGGKEPWDVGVLPKHNTSVKPGGSAQSKSAHTARKERSLMMKQERLQSDSNDLLESFVTDHSDFMGKIVSDPDQKGRDRTYSVKSKARTHGQNLLKGAVPASSKFNSSQW